MAIQNYITVEDIDNTSLAAFPVETKQKEVDKVNDFYEAHALSHDLNVEDLTFPILMFVKEALVYRLQMNMAMNRITGANTSDGSGPSKYDIIYSLNRDAYLPAINRVNAGLMVGINDKRSSTFTMINVEKGI